MKITLLTTITFLFSLTVFAQNKSYHFKAGFNAQEADDMLILNTAFIDTTKNNTFEGYLNGYTFKYRSKSSGLDNVWDLWLRSDSTVVITLRGTTSDPKSFMSDFYCAMFPAKGQIVLAPQDTIKYNLAQEPKATLHGGFLISFAYLAKDIKPKLDSLYLNGYRNYMVAGHSQGGALCFYISAWLNFLKNDGTFPAIQVKTYSSASPKVGNMFFVNDYDNVNHGEWSFSTINSADIVPESPLTTQQLEEDMNSPNPFLKLYDKMNSLPLIKRIVLKNAFNKMKKGAIKSSEAYQKYLGGYAEKIIKGMLPSIELPSSVKTTYFLRPGVNIALQINENYKSKFTTYNNTLVNHGMEPYRFLLREYYSGLTPLK